MKDITTSASYLYDGGWRPEDRDQLQREYNLSCEEADEIREELERLVKGDAKTYILSEEFIDVFGSDFYPYNIITREEVECIARALKMDIDELLELLVEA